MSSLTKLNLSKSRFTDTVVEPLCKILQNTPSLTHLDLTCIGLTSDGLRKFADDYLSTNPRKLTELNLSQNKFTDNEEQAFFFG